MVCFQAADGAYCLPVDTIRAVRTTAGMLSLPDAAADVTGLLPGDPPLTVVSLLQSRGSSVLVIEVDDKHFGLLVDKVTGLSRVDTADIRPSPLGQHRPLVCGTFNVNGQLTMVADAHSLAERL